MASLIDGKQLSQHLISGLADEVKQFQASSGIIPTLAVILVGADPASQVYVKNKIKRAGEVGIRSLEYKLPEDCEQQQLQVLIEELNQDTSVHGILVQLPLPKHLSEAEVLKAIDPKKDVDGFHPLNVGALASGQPKLVPCTPMGCLYMLKQVHKNLCGKHAVVIGRSNIVGKPMAALLLQENCTVTMVHSQSRHIEQICAQADILVAAVGRPKLIGPSWIKPGATIIDVGINAVEIDGKRKLQGDVDFDAVQERAAAITPVPGGVGPMTIAFLMHNTLFAAKLQVGGDS